MVPFDGYDGYCPPTCGFCGCATGESWCDWNADLVPDLHSRSVEWWRMWACDPTHGSGGAPSAAGPLGLVSSLTAGQSSISTISTGDPSRSRNERAGQGAKSTISIIAPPP